MTETATWCNATIQHEDGSQTYVRFDTAYRHVLADPSFTKGIWFLVNGIDTSDIDEYFQDLDAIELTIRNHMESCPKCHLLTVCTGAGYRDMVFAYGGPDMGFDPAIRALITKHPHRFHVEVHAGDFGSYADLLARTDS